tara:strand:+ start:4776 stop:5600 length:825 start_codon:yes stop_codon:yes gene_type:complete
MNFNKIISFLNESLENKLTDINDSLKKITGNDIEVSFSALNDTDSSIYLEENNTPFLSIDFFSKEASHQIIVQPNNSEKLTELLGNKVEGSLNEEHLNAINKASNLIIESFKDTGLSYSGAKIIDNSDNLNFSKDVKNQNIILKLGEDLLELNLYHWKNQRNSMEESTLEVQQADFGELGLSNNSTSNNKIDMLLEVELDVTIELGRKKMTIQEVLQLGKGSVIELSKLAGEPVDIFVNQKRLAQGEVVVVDENFAIRITNLIEKSERLKSLGK